MVTDAIAKVAANFGVTPIQGVLMHQMKRFVIDGNKVVIQKSEVDQEVDEIKFEPYEVYAVDVALSTVKVNRRKTMQKQQYSSGLSSKTTA